MPAVAEETGRADGFADVIAAPPAVSNSRTNEGIKASPVDKPKESGGGLPGTEFVPWKFVFTGKRISFNIELHVKRDTGGAGPVDVRLLKTSVFGWGSKTAVALAESTFEVVEIMPGVKAEVDVNAFEVEVSEEEIDISLLKIAWGVTGAFDKSIGSTKLGAYLLAGPLGPLLRAGATVEIEGKFELPVSAEDAARLGAMATASRQLAANGARVAKAVEVERKLLAERKQLKSLRSKRGAKSTKRLTNRLRKNTDKLKKVRAQIAERIQRNSLLRAEVRTAQKGLTSGMGRLAGRLVTKLGGRLLAKLVPGLNVITTVMDIYEIGKLVYLVAKGRAQFGMDGEGSSDDAGDQPDGGDTGDRPAGEDAGVGEPGVPAGPGEEPPDQSRVRGAEADEGRPGGVDLPPEVDISDVLDTSDIEAVEASSLHPAAAAVAESLRGRSGAGFRSRDLDQLNSVVPQDLTGEELEAVLADLRASRPRGRDIFAVIGRVVEAVRTVRALPAQATVTVGDVTEIVPFPEALGEEPAEAVAPVASNSPEIAAFLAAMKASMPAESEAFARIDDEVRNPRKGTVVHCTMAIRVQDGRLVGGRATVIFGDGPDAGGRWTVTLMSMPVYDEAGRLVDRRPQETSHGWSFSTKDR